MRAINKLLKAVRWFTNYGSATPMMVFVFFIALFFMFDCGTHMIYVIRNSAQSKELIVNKPSYRYLIIDSCQIHDGSGKEIGNISSRTNVYSRDAINSNKIIVTIYGWVWASSVVDNDSVLTVVENENIRCKADGVIFGRIYKGAILHKEYLNPTDSWYLFSLKVKIDSTNLDLTFDGLGRKFKGYEYFPRTDKDAGNSANPQFDGLAASLIVYGPVLFIFCYLYSKSRRFSNYEEEDFFEKEESLPQQFITFWKEFIISCKNNGHEWIRTFLQISFSIGVAIATYCLLVK